MEKQFRERVRKNAIRRIEKIANNTTKILIYTLDNYFIGKSIQVDNIYNWLLKETQDGGQLIYWGGCNYTLRIHSNLWFTLVTR